MFVTNWISTTKIQKISEITNFFRHYFLSRTEVFIYNKAQTFTSSGFAFPQKICIFAENFFKYGKDTNKI